METDRTRDSAAYLAAIDESCRERLDAVEDVVMKETIKLHRLEMKVQDVLAKQRPEEQEAASARRRQQCALMSALETLSKEPTG